MKIATLLAQYLYSNHRLDLPGIGTFLLDPSSINAPENSKQRSAILEGISFQNNPSLKESPDLIAYISAQTGKMKALANADLGSHLQLAQQFLNISKPFTFEGIGTLISTKPGELKFTPASVPVEKLKEYKTKESATPVSVEESSAEYESFLDKPQSKIAWKKSIISLLIIAGVGLAIWGGYTISKNTSVNDNKDTTNIIENSTAIPVTNQTIDTLVSQSTDTPGSFYKYVLEISNKNQAFRRYEQLKTNLWDVHMETNDSIKYKLFLLLPVENADTTRIIDSLVVLSGKRVYIEPQN